MTVLIISARGSSRKAGRCRKNALRAPESLVDVAEARMRIWKYFFAINVEAYETKTGAKFPYPVRPSAELSGDEWEEDDEFLKNKYPKLFARFWESDSAEELAEPVSGLAPVARLLEGLAARDTGDVLAAEALYRDAVIAALDETSEGFAKSAALLTQAADQGHAGAPPNIPRCGLPATRTWRAAEFSEGGEAIQASRGRRKCRCL